MIDTAPTRPDCYGDYGFSILLCGGCYVKNGCRITDDLRRQAQSDKSPPPPPPPPNTPAPSDGSTASYYELPAGAKELQDLIAYRNLNAQMGEIFRACYRYGLVPHSPHERDLKKIIFYAQAELDRLAKYPNK
jgi:hypothetical protein